MQCTGSFLLCQILFCLFVCFLLVFFFFFFFFFVGHHNLYRHIGVQRNDELVATLKQKLGKLVTAVSPLKRSKMTSSQSATDVVAVSIPQVALDLCWFPPPLSLPFFVLVVKAQVGERSSLTTNRLVGLVVRRLPRERKIPGSNPACAGIFSGSSHTSDLKIGTPVATLPGAWRYRVSTGTGRPGVSIL